MLSEEKMNFENFRKILTSKKVLKVIHSARQDIEVLNYAFGISVVNVFDTQIAYNSIHGEKPTKEQMCKDLPKFCNSSEANRALQDLDLKGIEKLNISQEIKNYNQYVKTSIKSFIDKL